MLPVALVSDVFHDADGPARLVARLTEARGRGATLALLPELPLNRWSPAGPAPDDDDAEPPRGARHALLARAAREAGIGVVGGAIVRDPILGIRRNTALVFDAAGREVAAYCKLHLPDEEGFRERAHYEPGADPPRPIDGFGLPFGIQICSDANRPLGSFALAAAGAGAILVPRATEAATFDRWRLVLRATALVSSAYVLSVNRPAPELGVPLGGPSVAIGPDGEVLVETTDPVALACLDPSIVEGARSRYPGYMGWRPELYALMWTEVAKALAGVSPASQPNR